MPFQTAPEVVARVLEGMGIALVTVGGAAAIASIARRLIAGDAFEAEGRVLRERLARATLLGLEFNPVGVGSQRQRGTVPGPG